MCGAGTYQSRSPTATSDRECTSCSLGVSFQDSVSHTSTTCKSVTTCVPGQFQSRPPTLTSDRLCADCSAGRFSTSNNAGLCQLFSMCGAGQFMLADGTPTLDRVCRSCTLGASYMPDTSHTRTACLLVSRVCAAGQYQSAAPTLSSDRACLSCASGFFNPFEDRTSCTAWTNCRLGQYSLTTPSTSTDRQCTSCDGVTGFQDVINQNSCKSVTLCASDSYQVAAPTPSSNRACRPCTKASDCLSTQFLQGTCPGGSGTSNPTCVNCHASCATCSGPLDSQCLSCPNGKTLSSGRCLDQCPDRQFNNGASCVPCHSTCFRCTGGLSTQCTACADSNFLSGSTCVTTCPPNTIKVASTNNNLCVACKTCTSGTWASTPCRDSTDTSCSSWKTCVVGEKEQVAPTSISDRVCTSCVLGTEFQDLNAQVTCKPATVCTAGQFESTAPTVSSDRRCSACSIGSYQDQQGQKSCLPCASGSFQDRTGASFCRECGAGLFQPDQGKASCFTIPAGSYGTGGTVNTRTGSALCEPGFFCLGGSSSRQECSASTFQDEVGKTSCKSLTLCQAGQFESRAPTSTSNRECSSCPSGTFQDRVNHAEKSCNTWTVCRAGQRQTSAPSTSADRRCVDCVVPNEWQNLENQASCRAASTCPAGSAQVSAPTSSTDRICRDCIQDVSFQDLTNQLSCKSVTQCRAGQREARAPTPTSDRSCVDCNGSTEFQDLSGQTTCKSVRMCGAGEFQQQAPTISSNRVCAPCRDGFQASTSHSSTTCTAYTTCQAGQYESRPVTLTSDRTCSSCSVGVNFQDKAGMTTCKPVRLCSKGEYEAQDATALSDRICRPCQLNSTYQDMDQHALTTCKTVSTCKVGESEIAAPTLSSDRICQLCNGVTEFQDLAGQAKCKPVSSCRAGVDFQLAAPTVSSDRRCATCTTKDKCNPNEYLSGTCGGGADGTENTRCAACFPTCGTCFFANSTSCLTCAGVRKLREGACIDNCPAGEYASGSGCAKCDATCATCNSGESTQCSSCTGNLFLSRGSCITTCPSGFFADTTTNQCKACSRCGTGTWSSQVCTPTADTVCSPWSSCKIGEKERTAGTSVSDRVCESCILGVEFQPAAAQTTCIPVSVCRFPDIESKKPTTSADRVCSCDRLACSRIVTRSYTSLVCAPPTSSQLDTGIASCCNGETEGNLRDNIAASSQFTDRHTCAGCLKDVCTCSAGYKLVTQVDDSQVCVACNGRTEYAPQPSATTCLAVTVCSRGQQQRTPPSPTSDRVCEDCPEGFIDHDSDGATPCIAANVGAYVPRGSYGTQDRYLCPAGTADTDKNPATECSPCVLGVSFQDVPGQVVCKDVFTCPAGQEEVLKSTISRDRVCQACRPGFFKDIAGQAIACRPVTDCSAGTEETQVPTISTDRVCTSCVSGSTFKSVSGQSVKCVSVTQCQAGEEEVVVPTVFQNRQCRTCEIGVTFKPRAGQDTRCSKVTACGPTEYMSRPATLTSDVQCTAFTLCKLDEYESEAPARDKDRKCTKCTQCPQGRFQIRACSALQDAQCAGCLACPVEQYKAATCTNVTNTVCLNCTACRATEFMSAPCSIDAPPKCDGLTFCTRDQYETVPATLTSNRACANLTVCASDEYEAVAPTSTSDRKCAKTTICRPGEEVVTAPGPTADRKCESCPAGFIDSDGNGLSRCAPCPTGSYVPPGQTGSCTPYLCPGGQADLDKDPATPCQSCEYLKNYSPTPGAFSCTPVKDCDAGTEQLLPPTLFADRVCVPCFEGITFKTDSGQDTKCQFVKRCNPAIEYVAKSPTKTSDRVCNPLTVCTSDEYQTIPPSESTDRVCTALTRCDPELEYQLTAPTRFTDRVCRNVTVCSDSEFESKTPTRTSDRECTPITVCRSNQIEVRAPTRTSDRLCNAIYTADMYFPADYNEVVGTPAGRTNFTDSLMESLTNSSIDPSKIIRMNITAGSIVVTLVSMDAGFRIAVYEAVSNGDISALGIPASPCPGKQYLSAQVSDFREEPRCVDYSICHRYEYVSRPPTRTSDVVCSTLTVCPAGEVELIPPTTFTDRTCGESQASTGKAMSAGVSAAIAVLVVLVIVVAVMFVVWRRRKASKDKRHDELVEKMARAMGTATIRSNNDVSNGNRLLRELTLQPGSVMLFDNPTFRPAGDDGYLDTRPDWLVGAMSREEAEAHIYANHGHVGDFVIRESATNGNFVLSILVKDGLFEHHKMYQDARGCWLLNGNRFTQDCRSLHEVVQHLSQSMDGTSVLLNFVPPQPEDNTYGKVVTEDNSYGKVAKEAQPDFYGSVKRKKPTWLKGEMSRKDAEDELKKTPAAGSFLVRESKGNHAISMVIDDGRMEHHVLKNVGGVFYLNDARLPAKCNSVEAVVEHLYDNMESMSCKLRRAVAYDTLPSAQNPMFAGSGRSTLVNPGYSTLPRGASLGEVGYQEPLPYNQQSLMPEDSFAYNKSLGGGMASSSLSNPSYSSAFRGNQGVDYFDPQPAAQESMYDTSFPRAAENPTIYSNGDNNTYETFGSSA